MVNNNRDNKGRFIKGRKVEQPRNNLGQFVPKIRKVNKVFNKKADSRAASIEDALVKGGSNINAIVETVMAVRTTDDPKKVKGQVSAILRDIRNEKGYWKKYEIINNENEIRIQVKESESAEPTTEPDAEMVQ